MQRTHLLFYGLWFDLATLGSLHSMLLLGEDNFHVAWRAHVRINTTVSTVCATALLLSTVHLNMRDEQLVHFQALQLSVCLSIQEKVEDKLCRLLWPPSLTVGCPSILGLGCTADSTTVAAECNSLLLLDDVLQVGLSLPEIHALDSKACLASVLKVNTKVGTLGL